MNDRAPAEGESRCVHCGELIAPVYDRYTGKVHHWEHVFYGTSGLGTSHEVTTIGDREIRCALYATPPEGEGG